MFHIVKFVDTNTVAVVPDNWIDEIGGTCAWPNKLKSDRIFRAVKRREPPEQNWNNLDCRSLKQFVNYEEARKLLPAAELTSDLSDMDTPVSGKGRPQRVRNRPRRLIDSSPDAMNGDDESDSDGSLGTPSFSGSVGLPPPPPPPAASGYTMLLSQAERAADPNLLQIHVDPLVYADARYNNYDSSSTQTRTGLYGYSNIGISANSNNGNTAEQYVPAGYISPARAYGSQPPNSDLSQGDTSNMRLMQLQSESSSSEIGFQTYVLGALASMKTTLNQIDLKLNKVLSSIQTSRRDDPPDSVKMDAKYFGLPISTIEKFKELNAKMSDNKTRRGLIEIFKYAGGSTCREGTRLILKQLMTNELATQYSSVGAQGKFSFLDLEFRDIIIESLKFNSEITDLSRDKVNSGIKAWLPHAPDRVNYQKRKQESGPANSKRRKKGNTSSTSANSANI